MKPRLVLLPLVVLGIGVGFLAAVPSAQAWYADSQQGVVKCFVSPSSQAPGGGGGSEPS
jgi:hypothetical protein